MTRSLDEFNADEATLAEVRAAYRRLAARHHKLRQQRQDLVEAVYEATRDAWTAVGARPVDAPARDRRRKAEEVALWHLTDWQGAKVTLTYDSRVMRERVEAFWERATAITEVQRSDHPVRSCWILFGGDMIEGLFNFPQQPFEIDATLFGQFVTVAGLIRDTVRAALGLYERVVVVPEWGNHGRIGPLRAAVPRGDNFDRMTYEHARAMLANEPRLTWQDCPGDVQQVEIGEYRALLIHGDEVGRTGFASRRRIVQHVNDWRSGAWPWPFRDCYVGHYHVHAEESLADGRGSVYWTGSTESDNRYARDTLASGGVPSQRLHFVRPDVGRVTANYRVWLD